MDSDDDEPLSMRAVRKGEKQWYTVSGETDATSTLFVERAYKLRDRACAARI